MLNFSLEDLLAFIESLLQKFKEFFAQFGILVLPEKDPGSDIPDVD